MKFPSSSCVFSGQGGSRQKEVQDTAYTLRNRYIVYASNERKEVAGPTEPSKVSC